MIKRMITFAILFFAIGVVIFNFSKNKAENSSKEIIIEDTIEERTEVSEETNVESSTTMTENESNKPLVKEGNPALDFKLTNLAGGADKLSDYHGKKVILNFWASWCTPCKAEMPHMKNFYEKNKESDIEILAVNLTQIDNGYEEIEKFVKDFELTFPILLDKNGRLGTHYQVMTIPTSYFIDSNGVIAKKIVGPMDEEMMGDVLSEID